MIRTISGSYVSSLQLHQVRDELLAAGLREEQMQVDEVEGRLQVAVVDHRAREVQGILSRHRLSPVTAD